MTMTEATGRRKILSRWYVLVVLTVLVSLAWGYVSRSLSGKGERSSDVDRVVGYVDVHVDELVEWLDEAVRIRSVSVGESRSLEGLMSAIDHFRELAERVGLDDVVVTNHTPGMILARSTLESPTKPTVVVYAHCDVQPARMGDGGWTHDPFRVKEDGERLRGRGVSDDKAAVVGWLWILDIYHRLGTPLGVNVRLLVEAEEETGSPHLAQVVESEVRDGGFLSNVDAVIISDGSFTSKTTPSVVIGTRGVLHVEVKLTGAMMDLHSGVYGGGVHEPLSELIHLLATVTDGKGSVTVDGFDTLRHDHLDDDEMDGVGLDVKRWAEQVGVERGTETKRKELLRRLWGEPSLTIHGVRSSSDYSAAAIPSVAETHFSIRIPPGMDPTKVQSILVSHLYDHFQRRNSPNHIDVVAHPPTAAFSTRRGTKLHHAVHHAVIRARKFPPEVTRLGGTLPVAAILASKLSETTTDIIIVPISGSDDGAHAYESIDRQNLLLGVRTFAYILHELSTS